MSDMNRYLSSVVKTIPPSGIRKFFDLVSHTEGVISLGVGEPDFVTPWHIREACWYSLEKGYTMYTSNSGLLELREEVAAYEKRRVGTEYDPAKEILITVGVSEAVDIALRALIEPGDEVLVPEPSYVSYSPGTALAFGVAVPVPTYDYDEYRLRADVLENCITPKSKILILPYPNNPTGAIMEKADLEAVAEVAKKHDLIVISDEIYGELTYNGRHCSITALPGMRDRTLLLNGFSKAFAMTGWRIGYACGHPDIIAAMTKIHQYTIMCAPIMAQKAACEALRNGEEQMLKMVENYNYRRKLLLKGLQEIGLDCFEPKGAFYCFPSIKSTPFNSEEFCEELLFEEKVAAVPGTAFGKSGEGFIRCCYAASVKDLEEAVIRMGNFLYRHR
ncbi:MAG TPA: aminotransferase class I/II-fold pyridoxal phosphate-dependent enzyme [Syntrophomonadaceae bacterium]|nr:aminotransferase class I/II-fold pyridoxal phosphate-dependent enzyme [Syntrophomonadaceae bacterium]HNX29706.1 aminotransferase class I/II-fold pyridoxal phosphate-dependent enzyme [Syntrophomonadaceae bacterium]HPR92954.1 aminotransferase class I/II-fold pyridoxal phosphate-dependent enzyme [Syntrophomonadaceae bacterium]